MLLSKSSGNQASLVPLNGTIRSMFDLEDPFATHRFNTRPTKEQYPKYQSAEMPEIPLTWPLSIRGIEPPRGNNWAH